MYIIGKIVQGLMGFPRVLDQVRLSKGKQHFVEFEKGLVAADALLYHCQHKWT